MEQFALWYAGIILIFYLTYIIKYSPNEICLYKRDKGR